MVAATMTDTLHDRIRAAVEERKRVAEAATPGPWYWDQEGEWGDRGPRLSSSGKQERYESPLGSGQWHEYDPSVVSGFGYDAWGLNVDDADAAHIALNDPARIIRDCERDLRVLERHKPSPDPEDDGVCEWCMDYHDQYPTYPCDEIRELRDEYGAPTP